MNYALDALWWRLHTPQVRDLASLLTAPAPWLSGSELPITDLLSEHGFRYLLALDDNPAALSAYLNAEQPFPRSLGRYAEHLLAFWFSHAPHTELLAHNTPVYQADGTTSGALDFIARLNGKIYHIELACKYYGSDSENNFAGLNPQEHLTEKIQKIQQQLALSASPLCEPLLAKLNIRADELHRASLLRGMLFLPNGNRLPENGLINPAKNARVNGQKGNRLPENGLINPLAWFGVYGTDWQVILNRLNLPEDSRFAPIDRMALLSPVRVIESETQAIGNINTIQHGMAALLNQRADGCWHEVQRIMKVSISI
ncbi:DUF1853 family protein [Stenoxybacter acetivorans]|uniref:DUF1853 family protein n=1 Tax=Stenoxybacter acetivorans TaxID=422441 RepID=UPI0005696AC9|nr:DUF1853 family protein [Stenoxybacter acetivorans]